MVWTLLRRGLVCGAVAGLLAGGFGFVVGEPRVQCAIDFEQRARPSESVVAVSGHAKVAHTAGGDKLVSRDGQRAGLVLATLLYGVFVGGLFALVFAVARGRLGVPADWALSTRLAGALFVAVVLLPFLKYPANPPAVGRPETIGSRTGLYLVMVAVSLQALLAAVRGARAVRGGAPPWVRPLVAGAIFVGTCVVAMLVLPGVHEVPARFPADLLWEFRLSSLGTQLVLWTMLGAGFGIASHRAAGPA